MNDAQAKELCLALMKADSEIEVINLLKQAGFWDNKDVWRFYGDYENNYNTIGNQQSRPDAALVEKVINAVDATLLSKCLGGTGVFEFCGQHGLQLIVTRRPDARLLHPQGRRPELPRRFDPRHGRLQPVHRPQLMNICT